MLLKKFTPEKVIETIFTDVEYEVLDKINLSFECSCSKGMLLSALDMFDDENKKEIIDSEENIEIVCEFCRKVYYISPEDLQESILLKNNLTIMRGG